MSFLSAQHLAPIYHLRRLRLLIGNRAWCSYAATYQADMITFFYEPEDQICTCVIGLNACRIMSECGSDFPSACMAFISVYMLAWYGLASHSPVWVARVSTNGSRRGQNLPSFMFIPISTSAVHFVPPLDICQTSSKALHNLFAPAKVVRCISNISEVEDDLCHGSCSAVAAGARGTSERYRMAARSALRSRGRLE